MAPGGYAAVSRVWATTGREEGLQQSPPQRPRRSRRSAYIPAVVPLFPDAPFPAAPKPRCLVVPFAFCLRLLRLPPCPKTGHFGVPNLGKHTSVPQNRPFWGPEPGKTHLRTPKQAFLVSRTRKNTPPCPKSCHFGFQNPETRPFVGQNRHFCPSVAGKSALRWAKQAFLPIGVPESHSMQMIWEDRGALGATAFSADKELRDVFCKFLCLYVRDV